MKAGLIYATLLIIAVGAMGCGAVPEPPLACTDEEFTLGDLGDFSFAYCEALGMVCNEAVTAADKCPGFVVELDAYIRAVLVPMIADQLSFLPRYISVEDLVVMWFEQYVGVCGEVELQFLDEIGTCQLLGNLEDPCAEDADCLGDLVCEEGVCAVEDQIAPVITSAYHVAAAAPDINSALPGDDGIWSVGDAVPETYAITIEHTEALAPSVTIIYTAAGNATCSATGIVVPGTAGPLTADITVACTGTGTVAAGDRLDITAWDPAGNPLTPDIILNGPGLGTNVNPIPVTCGNDIAQATEDCDGTDLNGEDCVSQGFVAGVLDCVDCAFDISACTTTPE